MNKLMAIILGISVSLFLMAPLALAQVNIPEFSVGTYLRATGDCTDAEVKACETDPKNCKCKSFQNMGYLDQEEGSDISPVTEIILRAIDMLVTIIGSVAALILIIGGILLATASGNEQQIQKGKDAMKYALIALLVTFLSFIIVTFVQSILT